jgi:hypothetical protein
MRKTLAPPQGQTHHGLWANGAAHREIAVELGGLMSYEVNYAGIFRHAATYVDKILKGARPADR